MANTNNLPDVYTRASTLSAIAFLSITVTAFSVGILAMVCSGPISAALVASGVLLGPATVFWYGIGGLIGGVLTLPQSLISTVYLGYGGYLLAKNAASYIQDNFRGAVYFLSYFIQSKTSKFSWLWDDVSVKPPFNKSPCHTISGNIYTPTKFTEENRKGHTTNCAMPECTSKKPQ